MYIEHLFTYAPHGIGCPSHNGQDRCNCTINSARSELSALKAEVERLRREREESQQFKSCLCTKYREEIERLRAKAALADEISAYQRNGMLTWFGWSNWFDRYDALEARKETT